MATVMAVQPLAPRPCSRDIAAWSPPKQRLMENNDSRPALKQIQQSAPQRPRRERKWTLSVSARKAPWISGALELLDATATMLTRLPSKPVSVTDDSEGMEQEMMMTGFGVGGLRPEMEVDGW